MRSRILLTTTLLPLAAAAQCLDLPGPDGFVSVPHDAALVPTGGITIEAWIVLSQTAGRPTIVRKNPAAFAETYNFRVEFGRPQFIVQGAAGYHTLWPNVTVPTGVPVHLAASYDGATSRLYMNGALVGAATHNRGPLVDTGGDLRIGKGDDISGGETLLGQIDAVRIWDHARRDWQIAGGGNREMPVGRGLVASWNFDADLLDTAGGRVGGATGSTAFANEFTTFATGLALPLAGGFVEVPHAASLVPADGLTIEAWVRLDPNVPGRPTVVRKNPGANRESYNLRIEFGLPQFIVSGSNGNHRLWPNVAVPVGVPTHLAATYDGATSALYMNGVLIGSATHNSGRLLDTGGTLRIGKGDDNSGEQFAGAIDSVRIWQMALTDTDLAWFRARSLHQVPGLIASWEFENDLLDGTGTNHGAAIGSIGYSGQLGDQTSGPVQAATFGTASSQCAAPAMVVFGLPALGNPTFGIGSTRGTPNAPHFTLLSLSRFQTPLTALGVQFWAPGDLVSLLDINGPTGVSRVNLPIPATQNALGARLFAQGVWLDAACGAQGLVGSNALDFTVW